jgi:hypothetical protein
MRWLIALAAMSIILVASAIEPPQPAPAPQGGTKPAAEQPADPKPPAAEGASAAETKGDAKKPADAAAPEEEEEELPPLPPDTVPAGPPPQRFNPTEKVRADFPVSFPIDI